MCVCPAGLLLCRSHVALTEFRCCLKVFGEKKKKFRAAVRDFLVRHRFRLAAFQVSVKDQNGGVMLVLHFSYPAVCDFLANNNLLSVIRAHEAQDAG